MEYSQKVTATNQIIVLEKEINSQKSNLAQTEFKYNEIISDMNDQKTELSDKK